MWVVSVGELFSKESRAWSTDAAAATQVPAATELAGVARFRSSWTRMPISALSEGASCALDPTA
jgi:hypothetical protein